MKKLIYTTIVLFTLSFLGTSNLFSQTANEPGSGNALSFDGVNNRVELPDINNIGEENNQSFTVECWFMSIDTGSSGTLVSRYYGYPSYGLFSWLLMTYPSGKVWFYLNNSQIADDIAIANNIVNGVWYHVAATYDGTTALLYINGMLEASATNPGGSTNPIGPISIGKGSYTNNNSGHPFEGRIDEVRIWNRALTQTEIRQNMTQKLTGNEPGLVGYWRFDEGNGNTAFDSSPNGNNGTLY